VSRILYRFVAALARFAVRSGRSKDLEIIVLRHQLAVLRRQIDRPALNDDDRSLLGAIAAALPRPRRAGWLVTPDTLLRWHRRRIARHWAQTTRGPGRLATSTVSQILKANGIDPAPDRSDTCWSQFLHSQTAVACDFFTVDTAMLRRYYVLFFIHIPSRQVFYAGVTANPTGAWTTQAARNLFLRHGDPLTGARALVRDRGSQFVDTFDEIFATEGLKVLKTPVRTPVANAFAERWIGSIRRELLDRTIIWNRHQLERLVIDYTDHYNSHRSLQQRPPLPPAPSPNANPPDLQVIRSTRCDGLIHEYRNAA
jgi:putative transposase